MPTALEELRGKIVERRNRLKTILEQHADGQGGYKPISGEFQDEIKSINLELEEKAPLLDQMRETSRLARVNADALKSLGLPYDTLPFAIGSAGNDSLGAGAGAGAGAGVGVDRFGNLKSLGQQFIESEAFRQFKVGSMGAKAYFESRTGLTEYLKSIVAPGEDGGHYLKSVMLETGSGYAPPNNRTNVVILSAQRKPVVADLIPSDPTENQTIKYMLETTFTNSAAGTSEGNSIAASALAFTQQTQAVEAIATTIQATNQQMADVPALRGLIDQRLMLMVAQSEDNMLINGNGTSPQLAGFLNKTGINTQTLGSDPRADAVMKAITQVRFNTGTNAGFAEPSGIIFHPTDWQNIRLTKDAIGNYLWGSPAEQGQFMIWGLPAIVTPVIAQGTALLGDFRMFSHTSRRQGVDVEVGYVNDDFQRYQVTIRAVERLSLEIYRPAAFCTVTGL